MPQARKHDLSFPIFATGGILAGAILFSFFEPEGTSHSTNVVLAIIIGAIALGTVVCAYVLPYIDAMSRLKGSFEWELTNDKAVQRHGDGRAVEIALHDIKSLHEGRGWLLVTGGEPSKGIAIPSDVEGFEQIRRELTAHCVQPRVRVKRITGNQVGRSAGKIGEPPIAPRLCKEGGFKKNALSRLSYLLSRQCVMRALVG